MDAIRCTDCGDVRWSLLGLKGEASRCTMCGGEMVPERRRPAAAPMTTLAERRGLVGAHERGPRPAA